MWRKVSHACLCFLSPVKHFSYVVSTARRGLQIGMVFQSGALFDSLSVGENVGFLLYEHSSLPEARIKVDTNLHSIWRYIIAS